MAYTNVLTLTPYGEGATPIVFPVESFGYSVEQTLNIGSQSTGAGAGKITFNPFSITRLVDAYSPKLLVLCASGTPYKTAVLSVTAAKAAQPLAVYTMKLVAIKTLSTAGSQHGGPLMETVTFEYGGLQIQTDIPTANGTNLSSPLGWNRVRNVEDDGATPIM